MKHEFFLKVTTKTVVTCSGYVLLRVQCSDLFHIFSLCMSIDVILFENLLLALHCQVSLVYFEEDHKATIFL